MILNEINLSKYARELHIACEFNTVESAKKNLSEVADKLRELEAQVVCAEFFGGKKFSKVFEDFKGLVKGSEYPTNHILPLDEDNKVVLAGVHVTALTGCRAEIRRTKGGSVVALYECGGIRYCRTFGVVVSDGNKCGEAHTTANLEELESILKECGLEYKNIARTWFYNDDILSWYPAFNKARTKFYSDREIFDGLLPASTGIGCPNPAGAMIESGVIAIKGSGGKGKLFEVESPLQCGAPNYGSSFSRAVEMDFEHYRRIMISGTASIGQDGKSLHSGDIEKQVDLTMRVIERILSSRGMDFSNTVRSVIYCLRPEYYEVFKKWVKSKGKFPHCPAYSIVCRDDLLFEVELDASENK